MIQLVYNTSDTMVVVDDDGRSVGGREWGVADSTSEPVKRALESGELIRADEDAARANNLPIVAVLDERRARTEQARALDVGQLREATGDADASKSELVREAAADPGVELPTTKPASTKSGRSGASGK